MGREVRRVPPDWEHPIDEETGRYHPMYHQTFREAMEEWYAGWKAWEAGEDPDKGRYGDTYYWELNGKPPDPEYHRLREWTPEEATHYMMYEDTSEGTPISPAFATPEELARWLADTKASANGGQPASYEAWLRVANGAWAPSMMITVHADGRVEEKTGVESTLDY